MANMVCVMTFAYRFEADAAKAFLESHGIEVMVLGDDCGGTRPEIGFATGGIKLHVPEEKAEEAMHLLQQYGKNK
jgi:hypothetical protein